VSNRNLQTAIVAVANDRSASAGEYIKTKVPAPSTNAPLPLELGADPGFARGVLA